MNTPEGERWQEVVGWPLRVSSAGLSSVAAVVGWALGMALVFATLFVLSEMGHSYRISPGGPKILTPERGRQAAELTLTAFGWLRGSWVGTYLPFVLAGGTFLLIACPKQGRLRRRKPKPGKLRDEYLIEQPLGFAGLAFLATLFAAFVSFVVHAVVAAISR